MKTIKNLLFPILAIAKRLSCFIFLICLVTACHDPDVYSGPAMNSGLSENIPYDAIGSGKLCFSRFDVTYIIDADARSSWGLDKVNSPVISPDGKRIAYQTFTSNYGKGYLEVYVYDIESRSVMTVSDPSSDFLSPSWTADSKNLLLKRNSEKRSVVLQSATSNTLTTIRVLTNEEMVNTSISASSQEKLAFSFWTTSTTNTDLMTLGIFTMNLDGTMLNQLTYDSIAFKRSTSPAWSPDGNLIAYLHYTTDESLTYKQLEVIVMDQDGKNSKTVVSLPALGQHTTIDGWIEPSIAWSPDGTRLAFNMYDADGVHIYVINSDGTGLTKVTSQPDEMEGHLSWSR